jgi:carbamoylphosphate synthase large subunit
MLTFKIIFYYILYSIKLQTKPWRFSQFNSHCFNEKKGIFSKYEIEKNIPDKWKLKNMFVSSEDSIEKQKQDILKEFSLPIFLKPEWGQNAHGILLAKTEDELEGTLGLIKNIPYQYICQQSSNFKNEYEILYTKNLEVDDIYIHSITQTLSNNTQEYPIN